MKSVKELCFGMLVLIACFLMDGYMFFCFWTWFVVAVFDARSLTYAESVGLMILIRFVGLSKKVIEDDDSMSETMKKLGKGVLKMAIFFGFAYVVHLLI